MNYTVFLDESGNSGRNHLDPEQPFYVLGGWIFPLEKLETAREIFLSWETHLKNKSSKELKSNRLLRKSEGISQILSLIEVLIKNGGVPVFAIQEKRYSATSLLIETFLGPSQNPAVSSNIFHGYRESIANHMYELIPDDILFEFSKMSKDRNNDSFDEQKNKILDFLKEKKEDQLASLINYSDLDQSRDFLFSGSNAENSINRTVLFTVIQMIEDYVTSKGETSWDLCHDKSLEFQNTYEEMIILVKSQKEQRIKVNNFTEIKLGSLVLGKMDFVDSLDEPLIRAADLYSGLISSVMKNIGKSNQISTEQLQKIFDPKKSFKCTEALHFYTISRKLNDILIQKVDAIN